VFRYRLRTLLIVLANLPPALAGAWLAVAWLLREPSRILGVAEVLYVLAILSFPIAIAVLFVGTLVRALGASLSHEPSVFRFANNVN
jgi:hypothetical protein